MKITTKNASFAAVMAKKRPKHRKPLRPLFLLQIVVRILAIFDLWPTKFTYETHGMEKIGKKEPCLILMNHSSFIDLKIASRIFFPKRYGIVCTSDGFVGFCMSLLMRLLGCIPTQKFVTDVRLIKDMEYLLKKKKTSVLMYPEASYSFDGTATPLPRKMGVLLKKLGVPVVTVITQGAFARDPLYNCLQKRKVNVRADVTCLATAEEVKAMTVAQLDALLDEAFGFDNFKWQQENKIKIDEPFRADGLNRILYKCPHCGVEGKTEGKGTTLTCHSCGKVYELTEYGYLKATDGEEAFRALETQVLAELGKQSGLIIATGGGCVTRERNFNLLHQNGTLFCLDRDLEKLPTDGRPLSQNTGLTEMYRVRKPLYDRFADSHIDNNGNPEAAAGQILRHWEGNI